MPRELRLAIVNCSLAIVYALFAYAHLTQFAVEPRLSVFLLVGMETLLVAIFLVRRDPDRTWHTWRTWLTTSAGTLFPLLLRPVAHAHDLPAAEVLQVTGACLQLGAVMSLNRSMGLLPAHREVKSNGLYRFVRHPLYASYSVALAGYVLNNWSILNVAIYLGGTTFQVLRIRHEEALLGNYPEYTAFADRTRWRLVPFVW
jgi:protein-S-isoprenylcysteine O-methyltransferase Ste14